MNKLATILLSVAFAVSASALPITLFSGETSYSGGQFDSHMHIFTADLELPDQAGLSWQVTGLTNGGNESTYGTIQFFFNDPDNGIIDLFSFDIPFGQGGFGDSSTTLLIPYNADFFTVTGFYIAGDGASSFNYTLQNLSIVPEPSTVALALGGAALVGAIFFRRRRAA